MNQFNFYANKPSENYNKIDMGLFASILLLWGLGIFTLFVCTQNYAIKVFDNDPFYFVKRQLISSAAGFVLFVFFMMLDMRITRKLISVIVLVALILCIFTFIPPFGIEKNGARRWLRMPAGFTFQPSELVKFAVVLFLANYFDKQEALEDPEDKNVFPCVFVLFTFVLVILGQKDFSTAIFVTGLGILLFIVSGTKIMWLIPFALLAIPSVILMITLEPYRLRRLIGWVKPDQYASGVNYQSLAAKRAITSGGIWGSGIGEGLNRIHSIPEVQSDYIFAGWSEGMGFLGVMLYIAVLVFFAYRGYKTALNCKDRFTAYASFGCVSVIFLQSIINTMVVCGLLPSTGIQLPFFSLGGSSIIVTLAMCGFILNASRCEEFVEKNRESDEISIESLSYL
ncbi:MAG: putative lipid II flippase FtsW [Treponema sp.]|nr:putative lipid II flippase FtsW [Treponema sp.]